MAHGACLVCAPTLMNPHIHENDGSQPYTCPRCGTIRLLTPYPEPYCWGCGRQFDWGQVVR
jgi:DNA-directed RNA polymerase subunit RPC12/RpoP